MNNFRKTMINIAAHNKDGDKLIPDYTGSYIRKNIEFIKFLSYVVNSKYDRINSLLSKDKMLLSDSEYEEIIKYKERERYFKLLTKYVYNTKDCTISEYKHACNYLYTHNIYEFVIDIFSKEEFLNINNIATHLTNELSLQELSNYLNSFNTNANLDKYNNLEIGDAYLLHLLQDKHKSLCEEEHKKELTYEKNRNDAVVRWNMKYFL